MLEFEIGTGCYSTKPFVLKLLFAKVKAIIRRAHSTKVIHHEDNSFDYLVVDNLSYEISVYNIEINLSPKEFELLNYFKLIKKLN